MLDTAEGAQGQKVSNSALKRRSLHLEVSDVIREAILRGELMPGKRLNERMLCETYGVSRTPLREAFKVLATEGLVKLLPNRGAMVTALSVEDFDATIKVMAHLEFMIGVEATENLDDDGIHQFRLWHHAMVGHFLRQELSAYFEINQKIHMELARRSGNAVLAGIYDGLNSKIRRYRYRANLQPDRWKAAVEEHEQILAALIMRDGKRVGDLLQDHLVNKAVAIRKSLVE